jgi:DNA polymerase-3 subunit alpha
MARACDLIRERTGKEYDLSNIPTDDPATFELLGRGQTAGVFQLEGTGMTRWVVEMKPRNLDNIIAMVALYRPGPMDFIPSYIRRMHGEEPIDYRHPSLEPIFSDTYGIPVYQEQIMRAAVEIGGFTRSESDDLRKAISKKLADKIAKNKEKFIKGAVEKGVMDKPTATAIFEDWEQFARYGFNKSHAADYGLVAVQTAYLKAHYPAEYMSALMTVFKDTSDKVALYISDARAMGIEVLSPDVNRSRYFFSIEDCPDSGKPAIRFGMGAVKNVGQGPVDAILLARKQDDAEIPFKDINDFAQRADLRTVGKRALECLIKVGAFDQFGSRAGMLAALDQMVAASSSHMRAAESGQMSMFGGASGLQAENIRLQELPTDRKDTLAWERELLGLYLSDHPLSAYTDLLTRAVSHNSITLNDAGNQERVRVAGLVISSRAFKTKKDTMMGFVTLEDMQGNIELVIFPKTWDKFRHLCVDGKVVVVDGKADGTTPPKVLVDEIKTDVTFYDSVAAGDEYLPPAPGSNDGAPAPRPALVKRPEPAPRAVPRPQPAPVKIAEPAADYIPEPDDDDGFDDMPPPPEAPPDWDDFILPAKSVSAAPPPQPAAPLDDMLTLEQYGGPTNPKPAPPVFQPVSQKPIVPPTTIDTLDDGLPPRIITVYLRPSSDQIRDRRRIKNVYGILISHPGRDRFSFYVTEEGRGHLIDFPNDTTRICVEMLDRLKKLLGSEDWRIEEIQYQ